MVRFRWLPLVMLGACICPRQEVMAPPLNGRIVDEGGAPHPEAQAEVCQNDGNLCSPLPVSSAATFHASERSETTWGCLCVPNAHPAGNFVVRVTADGMLPAEVAASGASQVVLHPRSVELDGARRSLVVLYRSVQGFAVVLTAAWIQEATKEGFSLRAPTPGGTLEQALAEVERALASSGGGEPMSCRPAVQQALADTSAPFLVRYGSRWLVLHNADEHSPLRRLVATLQPGSTESHDDAPAALALAHGDADRVAEEICGAAVGAAGGVALLTRRP